ncbi:MAG: SIMPL domain-containing protein [Bacteroidetes bacterium]|nr:SIMPL domain-containing protein [Bacteroidota bacterium]
MTYIIKFSDTKSIDKLVPALNDNAVTNMYISKVSHSKMETFRKEIKIKSVQAAREKAIYLAESIGEKVGPALLIEEVDFGGPQPMMYKSNMMMEAADAPYGGETSMPFEKIKIRFETRVEFELN